jgi:hypothetical protein
LITHRHRLKHMQITGYKHLGVMWWKIN